MKDACFTIEFVTHCLAGGGNPEENIPDTFQRDSQDNIITQASWWHAAFTRAIDLARLRNEVVATDIQVDPMIKAQTGQYERRFGEFESRLHEAIMAGTKITVNAMVEDHITQGMLKTILERMGKYVGFSVYGHKLGMGKFNVITVTVQED